MESLKLGDGRFLEQDEDERSMGGWMDRGSQEALASNQPQEILTRVCVSLILGGWYYFVDSGMPKKVSHRFKPLGLGRWDTFLGGRKLVH